MDDLMNKVGALIEEHVKGEVDARRVLEPSEDEVRRGARALGFWEKLVETLSDGRVEDANFDDVMAKIQALRDTREEWQARAEDAFANIDTLCNRVTVVRAERDEAKRTEENFTAQFNIMRKERDEYHTMWEQLHRAQGEDLDAKEQLKELLGALGLAHFDRNTIAGAIEATRKRDARLVSERDTAKAQLEVACAKVRELDAKLLEVRIAIAP